MDRQKRKANLKKLQLPASSAESRKTRSTTRPKTPSTKETKISEFFNTPSKLVNNEEPLLSSPLKESEKDNIDAIKSQEKNKNIQNDEVQPMQTEKNKRSKRTKLTNFVYKNKEDIPENVLNIKKRLTVNDFETVEKTVKKAPQIKPSKSSTGRSRGKKQQSIKSAFLRNEQIFSEIAAQHCIAENFSPDEIQMALAISKSEAEANGVMSYEVNNEDVVEIIESKNEASDKNETIRTKLKKYGFRTCAKEEYSAIAAAFVPGASRRAKTKWANKFTALTLRNPEYQQKKLNDKVEKFLQIQNKIHIPENKEDEMNDPLLPYRFLSKGLNKVSADRKNHQIIFPESDELVKNNLKKYFVVDLFPISEVNAGYLLKDWKAIQGRDLSPQKNQSSKAIENTRILEDLYKELEMIFENYSNDPEEEELKKNSCSQETARISKSNNFFYKKSQVAKTLESSQITVSEKNVLPQTPLESPPKVTDNREEDSNTSCESGENELNAIIDLIEQIPEEKENLVNTSLSPLKEPPDKRAKIEEPPSDDSQSPSNKRLKLSPGNISFMKSSSCRKILKSQKENNEKDYLDYPSIALSDQCKEQILNCSIKMTTISSKYEESSSRDSCTLSTQQRCHSPDIFADSDENEDEVEAKHGITLFETYSSDEVKNSSKLNLKTFEINKKNFADSTKPSAEEPFIDLTQDGDSNSGKTYTPPLPPNLSVHKNKLEILEETFDLTEETPPENLTHKPSNENENLKPSPARDLESHLDKSEGSLLEVLDLTEESPPLNDLSNSPRASFSLSNDFSSFTLPSALKDSDKDLPKENLSSFTENDSDLDLLKEIANEDPITSVLKLDGGNQMFSSFHKETSENHTTKVKSKRKVERLQPIEIMGSDKDSSLAVRTSLNFRKSVSMTQIDFDKTSHSFSSQSKSLVRSFKETKSLRNEKSFDDDFLFKNPSDLNISSSNRSRDLTSSLNFSKNKSSTSSKSSEISIDLTQDDPEETEEDEDDCLMLSDDEINYSMWKANKTMLGNTHHNSGTPLKNFKSSFSEAKSEDFKNLSSDSSDDKDYSVLDLLKDGGELDLPSLRVPEFSKTKSFPRCNTDFNLNDPDDEEPIRQDYLLTPSKQRECLEKASTSTLTTSKLNLSKEREQFGILESYSESLNLSQLEAIEVNAELNKNENDVRDDNWLEASFLHSPSNQIVVPSKRKSNKFENLIKRLSNVKSFGLLADEDEEDEIDEFDLLVKQGQKSPENESSVRVKTPTDFDQLLTAEISFNAEFMDYGYPEMLVISPEKLPSKTRKSSSFTGAYNSIDDYQNHLKTPEKLNGNLYKTLRKSKSAEKPSSCKEKSPPNCEEKSFEAPQNLEVNGRTYTVRVVKEQKPDFSKFSEAELLKKLYNFGIKPLKRKQAVKLLEYIYNQTHPVLLPEPGNNEKPSKNNLPASPKSSLAHPVEPQEKVLFSDDVNDYDKMDDFISQSCAMNQQDKTFNLKDSYGHEILKYKEVLFASLVDGDEEYIFQTNITKKTPQPLLPFHIAWHNLICSNTLLHEAVIMYEAIDLQEIYLFFKNLGYRYDPKDMRTFFDRRCIIFRYDLTPGNKTTDKNRHVRNPKNAGKKKKAIK